MTTSAGFWDNAARRYAAAPVKDTATYEAWLARVIEHLGPDDRVLEVGCGTGSTALRLAPYVKSYLSTDYAAGMIEIAKEKLKEAKLANLHFMQADPFDPRLKLEKQDGQGGYDAVLAFNLLHLADDPGAMVHRIHDLVKPGGLFVSKTACLGNLRWLFKPLIAIMRLFGKAPRAVQMITPDQLDSLIEQGGFEIIEEITFSKPPNRFLVARKV